MASLGKSCLVLAFLLAALIQNTQVQGLRRCDVPADVVFLMDSSISITYKDWDDMKMVVGKMIESLDVAKHAIHVGVIQFARDIGMKINLQPYKTKAQLNSKLKKMRHIRKKKSSSSLGTNTAKAIRELKKMSLDSGRFQASAKQIGVIITDGKSDNSTETKMVAEEVRHEYDIDMIAIGINDKNTTFGKELVNIVGIEYEKSRAFELQNFSQLHSIVSRLKDIICQIIPSTRPTLPPMTTPPSSTLSTMPYVQACSLPADVIFVIDGSYSITAADWVRARQFVAGVVHQMDVALDKIRVGYIVYGGDIGDTVYLTPFTGKKNLEGRAIKLAKPSIGRTNTGLALKTMREIFQQQGRPGIPAVGIVITDGQSSNLTKTKNEFTLAKNEGIQLFAIAVGDGLDRQETMDMASKPLERYYFETDGYQDLLRNVTHLRDNICTALDVKTTTPTPPTTTEIPIPDICKECLVEGGIGFNHKPGSCHQYVKCVPEGSSYTPHVLTCPFGLFWSQESTSCLDARYVKCPDDKCSSMWPASTYHLPGGNCRSYYSCSANRTSTPSCCKQGHRYVDGVGCTVDALCQADCPLHVTIFNSGSCRFRINPDSLYTFYELVPGQGQVLRQCPSGQVYDDKACGCSYRVSSAAVCSPLANLTFNGNFEDNSPNQQPMEVVRLSVTNSATAYFSGNGYLSMPGLASLDFGSSLVIRLRYRRQYNNSPNHKTWNSHWGWGMQNWFNNASRHGQVIKLVNRTSSVGPNRGVIRGAETTPLEALIISQDGTVTLGPGFGKSMNTSWPSGQSVSLLHLGLHGSRPAVRSGALYIPNGRGHLLIQSPDKTSGGKWLVAKVSHSRRTGNVVQEGQGQVPQNVQEKWGFDLGPPLTMIWYAVTSEGRLIDQGQGAIGISAGTHSSLTSTSPTRMVKIYMRGMNYDRWEVTTRDGGVLLQGKGRMPQALVRRMRLEAILNTDKVVSLWSVLGADGTVLETGQGTISRSTLQKYQQSPNAIILMVASRNGGDTIWGMMRPSGIKLIQRQGHIPNGIVQFVKGTIKIPQITTIQKWTVTLPNGTMRSGTGDIPQEIQDMFQISAGKINGLQQHSSAWISGTRSGPIRSQGSVVHNSWQSSLSEPMRRSKSTVTSHKEWRATMPDGSIQSGLGDPPSHIRGRFPRQASSQPMSHKSHVNAMDIVANCGQSSTTDAPSIHITDSGHDVSLTLVNEGRHTKSLSLPVHEGMNDVLFIYNGQQIKGVVNGVMRQVAFTGNLEKKNSMFSVGRCQFRNRNYFKGEIDQLEIYNCLP